MKPTKGRVFCNDCGRHKLLFDSEAKALTFMKFNNESIEEEGGYAPIRAYYCISCAGWHVTSREKGYTGPSRTEVVIQKAQQAEQRDNERARQLKEVKLNVKQRERALFDEIGELTLQIDTLSSDETDKAVELLKEAYEKLNITWNMVEFKAEKKRIHKKLDFIAQQLGIKPIKIPY